VKGGFIYEIWKKDKKRFCQKNMKMLLEDNDTDLE
jgi:hypothetical protein